MADALGRGRPSILSEDKLLDISDKMSKSLNKSVRKLAQESDVSVRMGHTVVRKKLELFPYKLTVMQELKNTDHGKKLHYYQ